MPVSRTSDPSTILREVLSDFAEASKWIGAPFEHVKRLSNTKVGDVGQEFIARLCREHEVTPEFPTDAKGKRRRTHPWDIRICGVSYELKTATEDVSGSFQFNHIRYHRDYGALLCLGIAPDAIWFRAWRKGDVATGVAGKLVSMDKGSSATWKLTKKPADLRPISEFQPLRLVNDPT